MNVYIINKIDFDHILLNNGLPSEDLIVKVWHL